MAADPPGPAALGFPPLVCKGSAACAAAAEPPTPEKSTLSAVLEAYIINITCISHMAYLKKIIAES